MTPANDMDSIVARKMYRTLEVYHGMIYFVPEARAEYRELGVPPDDYFTGYFASRASALGPVSAEVVVATFFNFNPSIVHAAVPSAWALAPPEEWQAARRRAASAALRRLIGDAVETAEMDAAVELASAAAHACEPAGRPLYAAHAALDWPDEPHLQLWHAITLLREHRGDGHVALLTGEGLSACEALVLHGATGMVDPGVLQSSRAWPDDDWAAARQSLCDRGLMVGDQLTKEGTTMRDALERRTDELALAPWRTLGEDGCRRLRELVRPWSKAIAAGLDVFGSPST